MNLLQVAAVLLVLLNLAFVQVTDAVGVQWLLPMYALTCAAPWTVRWRDNRLWRTGWNLGVLAIFSILLRDFVTSGPRHLLEDGLTLAASCQVHLLNALRRDQRPDLLFFNSFLIALVTSFFCQDLIYSVIFVAYALTFLPALQIAATAGETPARSALSHALVRDGVRRAAVVLAVTGLVFVLWPRDFRRPGLIEDDRWLERLTGTSATGFVEEVRLGRSAHAIVDERVVLRIRLLEGRPGDVPSHWRGATMTAIDRHGWRRAPGAAIGLLDSLRTPWRPDGVGSWSRDAGEPARGRVRVAAESAPSGRLFLPLGARSIRLTDSIEAERVVPLADASFRHHAERSTVSGELYEVEFGTERAFGSSRAKLFDAALLLQIDREDDAVVPPAIHDLIEAARDGLPPDVRTELLVERCRALLAERFQYLLPGEQGAATDFAAFVSGEGGGHCELFATALAVMLRLQAIPCRLVSGYLVDEWDEARREFVVRAADAHAWVEWWDPASGAFVTADPTPSAPDGAGRSGGSWFARLGASVHELWTRVTRFDPEDRRAVVDWLVSSPQRLVAGMRAYPASTVVVLLLVIAGIVARSRRRAALRTPVHVYRLALRRAGLALRPGETPRELVIRARDGLPRDRYEELIRATEDHERSRFA